MLVTEKTVGLTHIPTVNAPSPIWAATLSTSCELALAKRIDMDQPLEGAVWNAIAIVPWILACASGLAILIASWLI
jgi:hypothetical protein